MTFDWSLARSEHSDALWMAELRAEVMRADLERLGRWDPLRVRQRFLDAFESTHTSVIQVGDEKAGLIAVRPEGDSIWIEHFYLQPTHQGRGLGGQVLRQIMAEHGDHRPFRLNVLQGSPARHLYERNGFVFEREDPIDVFLVAPPRDNVPTFLPLASELETARLRMRPWTPSDSDAIRLLWKERDPRSLHVIDSEGRPTVEDFRVRIESQIAESAQTGLSLLAIETKHDGEFIGYCGLIIGKSTLEEPEIAFELFQRAHGNGYATEASRAVLSAAQDTGRTRLWATVRAWNLASFRVLEKIGFVDSGKVDPDSERGDSVWMTWPGSGEISVSGVTH